MKKYTLTVVFDHRGRTERGKEGPLEIRITVSRKRTYINTGMRVRRSEFTGSVVNRLDAAAMNNRLSALLKKVAAVVDEMIAEGREIDSDSVKERLWKSETATKDSLLIWIDEQVKMLPVSEGRARHYATLIRRLDEYGALREWEDVTIESIYKWDAWLHTLTKPQTAADIQAGVKPVKISDASVWNYHKNMKTLLYRAERMGKIDRNPYSMMRNEFKKGTKENVEYLTEDEMKAVMSIRPVPGTQMAAARDLFVFQMFTGLSYSDAQAFDISKYKKVDGKWIHTGQRVKTGVPFVNQLLPPAVEVLERYGMQAPKIGNADYNHALKAIQLAAGITTRLHSHLARHTFATFMLSKGVSLQNVSKMLGHTNITQPARYAKVLAQSVHDDFAMIAEMLEEETEKGEQ